MRTTVDVRYEREGSVVQRTVQDAGKAATYQDIYLEN